MQDLVSAFQSHHLNPCIVNLEHPGCLAQINEMGPGPIMFRPHLHLTRFDSCIRHMGILRELGHSILPSWPAVLSYDDKIVQAEQLHAARLPHCETRVVTCPEDVGPAMEALGLPVVVKLRNGAGSLNVRRIDSLAELHRYAQQMFGRGISPVPGPAMDLNVNIRKSGGILKSLEKAPGVIAKRLRMKRRTLRERGYVLMQRFYEKNDGDVRVTVLGDRAFVFKRRNRPGDFRASGSGQIEYIDPRNHKLEINLAFSLTDYLQASFLAVDMIQDNQQRPIVVEYCPGFVLGLIAGCDGFIHRNGQYTAGTYQSAHLIAQVVLGLQRGT